MKSLRLFLMVAVVIGMGSLVSCSKESPAEEIDNTTQKLEGEAVELKKEADAKSVDLQKEADKKAAEILNKTQKK